MKQYILTFKNQNATVILTYNETGWLQKFEIEPGTFAKEHYDFLFSHFPAHTDILQQWIKSKFKNVRISSLERDLSFKTFYDAYNYKVSKRKTAERIWEKMNDVERAKAIDYIKSYEIHLIKTSINKKCPETYLNSEMWNN